MPPSRKVMIIGADGATFDVMRPLLDRGELPNIKRLMDSGSWGEMATSVPNISPAAWTSFVTGVTPGRHGIFDFVMRAKNSYDIAPAASTQRRVKPFWKVMREAGKKVVVLNVPATFPPDEVDGLMIAGDPTPFHDQRRVYPPESFAAFAKEFGDDFLRPLPPSGSDEGFLNRVLDLVDVWTKVSMRAMERVDWDAFMVVYTATDVVQHFFWRHRDPRHPLHDPSRSKALAEAVDSVYRKIDKAVGELVSKAGPDVDVVFGSDHGFGPLYRNFSINGWLESEGYLKRDRSGAGFFTKLQGVFNILLHRAGIKKGLPQPTVFRGMDWGATKAYNFGAGTSIYVNLKGREPQGVVDNGGECAKLVDEIATRLESHTTPDGVKPVARAVKGRELYPGEADAPDIMVKFAEGFDTMKEGDPSAAIKKWRGSDLNKWSGTHRDNGVLIISGPSARVGKLENARIVDVAPTVYQIMGIGAPGALDGRVLGEGLKDASVAAQVTAPTLEEAGAKSVEYTDDEMAAIEEKLKNLGYLE